MKRFAVCWLAGCILALPVAVDFTRTKATSPALNSDSPFWTPHAPTLGEYIVADVIIGGMVSLVLLVFWAAWRFDRRIKVETTEAGHCRLCSYNLTGNTSGVCPECGENTTPPSHGASH